MTLSPLEAWPFHAITVGARASFTKIRGHTESPTEVWLGRGQVTSQRPTAGPGDSCVESGVGPSLGTQGGPS